MGGIILKKLLKSSSQSHKIPGDKSRLGGEILEIKSANLVNLEKVDRLRFFSQTSSSEWLAKTDKLTLRVGRDSLDFRGKMKLARIGISVSE